MIRNYLRVFTQNLRRHPVFSLLSILGLSLGIGISYIVALYTMDELSYDQFHRDSDRIYRIGIQGVLSGNEFVGVTSCAPLSKALNEEVPGVELSIRLGQRGSFLIHQANQAIAENDVLLSDPEFFEFWDFALLAGDARTALSGEKRIILTETLAAKYFPDLTYSDVIGQTLLIGNGKESHQVTGVMEDTPKNSHFTFPLILSMDSWDYSRDLQWTSNSLYTYFKIAPATSVNQIEESLDQLITKYVGPEIQQYLGISLEEFRAGGGAYGYFAQPLSDIHLHSHYEGEMQANGDMQNLIIFGIVGIFVLLIAGINFVNLSTARATDRAKEVGIRKAIGAQKSQLILQHMLESFSYCLIAGIIALVGVALSLDFFNHILDKEFVVSDLIATPYIFYFLLFILLVSILSGVYPSLILSSFQPVKILKGLASDDKSSKLNPRNLMVGFQFALTTLAIVLTITVFKQLEMMRNKNLGFEKDQLIVIYNARGLNGQNTFKNALLSLPEIESVSMTNGYPPQIDNNSVSRVSDTQEDHLFWQYSTDVDHLETFGFELIEGRFFEDASLDSNAVVMNRAAMKLAGWESIDGKRLEEFEENGINSYYHVVGVVEDFHFQNFRAPIQPIVMYCSERGRFVTAKLSTSDIMGTVAKIESFWAEHSGGKPFDYNFVDSQFDQLFDSERRLAELTSILTLLTIITASLGLFGLAAFVARSRRKEFSIRKVLGASTIKVVVLQFRYFLTIAAFGLMVAIPVSYRLVQTWLNEFEYRIANDWTIYIGTILSVLALIMITVGYQSYKASVTPITRVLREE